MARERFHEVFPDPDADDAASTGSTGTDGGRRPGYGPRIAVEGGIAARSRRGRIGESWWSGRFLTVVESITGEGRLARGRTYARAGQVTELDVAPGTVTATVQGSRAEPYRVRIGLRVFPAEAWDAVERAFAADAWYAASLLSGEVPADVEGVFDAAGVPLFPQGPRELPVDCDCPDWSSPCKHAAAVVYLLAEAFDDDPFALLRWRGRPRAALLAGVRDHRDGRVPAATPVADALDRFWDLGGPVPGPAAVRGRPEDLLDAMPPLGVPVMPAAGGAAVDLRDALRPLYRRFAADPGGPGAGAGTADGAAGAGSTRAEDG